MCLHDVYRGIEQETVLPMSLCTKPFNQAEISLPLQPLLDSNHVSVLDLRPESVMRVGHGEAVGLWPLAQVGYLKSN